MFKAVFILAGMTAYVISPIDVLPDFVPLLGQVDDFAALLLGATAAYRSWTGEGSGTLSV